MESLGHLCKILYSHDTALDILSLHIRLADLIAQALVILEDYDCETEGKECTPECHGIKLRSIQATRKMQ